MRKIVQGFVFIIFLLSATNIIGQDEKRIDITMRNVSLDKIFAVLNAKTGWTFVYDINEMRAIGGVSLEKHNASLNEIIKSCLTATPYTCQFDNKNKRATITKKKVSIRDGFAKVSGIVINDARYDTILHKVMINTLTNAQISLTHNGSGKKYELYSSGNGSFFFNKVPSGNCTIKVTFLSKEDYEQTIDVDAGADIYLYIQLQERSFDISQLTVKGGIPLLEIKGDTIQINSKILHTIDGSRAEELLQQVPGVEIENGVIKAFGELVHRTYLNNELFFGPSATAAFQYLPAKEVADMQVYDETKVRYNIYGKTETYKERVINIRSKTEIKKFLNGQALVGVGRLFNDSEFGDNLRYRGNISLANFIQGGNMTMSLTTHNTNDVVNGASYPISPFIGSQNSGTYQKLSQIDISTYKYFSSKKSEIRLSYKYDKTKETSNNGYELDYYPTHFFNLRKIIQENISNKEMDNHNLNVSYFGQNFTYDNTTKFSRVVLDNVIFQEQLTDNVSMTSNVEENKIDRHVVCNNSFYLLHHNIVANFEYMPGKRFRLDSASTSNVCNTIRSKPNGLNYEIGINSPLPQFNFINKRDTLHPKPTYYLTIGMDHLKVNFKHNKSKEIRYNETSQQNKIIDNANSFDYTNNFVEVIYPTIIYAKYKNTAIPANISIDWRFVTQMDHCKVPVSNKGSYNFFVPSVMVSGKYTFSKLSNSSTDGFKLPPGMMLFKTPTAGTSLHTGLNKGIIYSYQMTQQVPSVEQLRQRVDDTNPIWLVAGNSNLKPNLTHLLNLTLLLNNLSISASANITQNQIVQKQEFFNEETELKDYNGYKVLANSTLSTYENINGCHGMSLEVTYDERPKKMVNSRIAFSLNTQYRHYYSYIQSILEAKNNFSTEFNIAASSFVKNFKGILKFSAEYGKNFGKENSNNDIEYFKQAVDLSLKYTIKDLVYAAGYLNVSNWNPIKSNSLKRTTTNVCNFELGTYVYKKYFEISTSVYDIFNSKSAFSSLVGADYTKNSWSPTFGRYWMFNIRLMIDRIKR